MNSARPQHQLRLDDLGLGERPITASVWLVDLGDPVTEGDRLLEVSADSVTIDLPAPVSGVLVAQLVEEGERLTIGQTLALIEETDALSSLD